MQARLETHQPRWLIADRQLECCLAPVEAERKGAAQLGRLPTAGCHAQSSLNCTGRGSLLRESGYHKVYGETTKRAPEASVFTAANPQCRWREGIVVRFGWA